MTDSAPSPVLAREVDALLAGQPGLYGVVAADARGRIIYQRNADLPFVAASLFKLPVMAAVHAAAAAGSLSLDEPIVAADLGPTTVADALEAMIAHSHNGAAFALIDRVGLAAVNDAAAELGLTRTRVGFDPAELAAWPLAADRDGTTGSGDRAVRFLLAAAPAANGWPDVTTPRDTAAFFRLLLDGAVVNRRASKRMLRLLGRQAIADRFPALLPAGTAVAHKTGNLPGVVHDAGIVYTPTGPVVLVALAEDLPDEARAASLFRRLALIVHDHAGGRCRPAPPRLVPRRDGGGGVVPSRPVVAVPRHAGVLTGAAGTPPGC